MKTLNVLLTHQQPAEVAAMIAGWGASAAPEALFIAYGGPPEHFPLIGHPQKTLIESAGLRTRDHQREKQSYAPVYAAVAHWLRERDFTHVRVAEFDHLPLVADLNARQTALLDSEGADVMGFRVRRVDETNYPNYLYHAADPRFHQLWREMSCRADPSAVLRMFGTGCVWRRKAFEAVAARPNPFRSILNFTFPPSRTTSVFGCGTGGEQNRFVHHLGDFTRQIEEARRNGAWTLHPVKRLWTERAKAGFRRG